MDQGRSHASSFAPLMNSIQKYNHSVGLFSAIFHQEIDFKMEEKFINMSEYQTPFSTEFFNIIFHQETNFLMQAVAFSYGCRTCEKVLKYKLKEFNAILENNWDLYLTDSLFSPCGYLMAHISKKPVVLMHSSDLESSHGTLKAYSRNFATFVPYNLPSSMVNFKIENFFNRAYSAFDWMGNYLLTVTVVELMQKWTLRSQIGFPYFSFSDYVRKTSFSFTDMTDHIYPPASRTNDFFAYGSYCLNHSINVPENFRDFIEDPKSKGTILIAFGTIIDWRFAPKEKVQIFIEVVNKLVDYRVIWSMKGDRPVGLKDHVMTSAWVPQNQILHHNNTKLFISHGGLKSMKESICTATPALYMPMFAEQMRNAWLVKEKGFGRIIDKLLITVESLEFNIHQLLNSSLYQRNANKFLSYYLDQPISNLEEGAFKLNKLLKYNGKMPRYFYPKSIDYSFFKLLNLDFMFIFPILCIIFIKN